MPASEREKRLRALEAQAQAEAEQAAALWIACQVCGHGSHSRQLLFWDGHCAWCGAGETAFYCPKCRDRHDPAARLPSEWSPAGICPTCQYTPPPLEQERYAAWHHTSFTAHHYAMLELVMAHLDAGTLTVRAFDPSCDVRREGRQIQHMCWAGADKRSGIALGDPIWAPLNFLQLQLDGWQKHTGAPFCQSTAEARAVLVTLLQEGETHATTRV